MSEQEVKKEPTSEEVEASITKYQAAKHLGTIVRVIVAIAIVVVFVVYILVGYAKIKAIQKSTPQMMTYVESSLKEQLWPQVQEKLQEAQKRLLPKLKDQAIDQGKAAWPEVQAALTKELDALRSFAEKTIKEQAKVELEDFARQQLTKTFPNITDEKKLTAVVENFQQAATEAAINVFIVRLDKHLKQLDNIQATLDRFPPPERYLDDEKLRGEFFTTLWEVVGAKAAKLGAVE